LSRIQSKSETRIKFFESIFEDTEGYLCIATTLQDNPKISFKQRFFEWPKEYKKIENYILGVEQEHNVYFCINLLERPERKKGNCLPTNLLWADLDDAPTRDLPPQILIQSSPGKFQGIWRISVEMPPYQAEDYSHRIAHHLNADSSGWDLTQLLRVPFTKNFKYMSVPLVQIEFASELAIPPLVFEKLQPVETEPDQYYELPSELPDVEQILYKYRGTLKQGFQANYSYEPAENDDWSKFLWRLIHECLEAGMEADEAFVVASSAPSNKYARDKRPPEHLWREVLKAQIQQKKITPLLDHAWTLKMPELVSEPATGTIIDTYRDWAKNATDAVVQFHDLACMVLLSAIVSGSLRVKTSYSPTSGMAPNIWGLILGDSSLTRKTTAMTMAVDFLIPLESEMVVATDASPEGLLSAISGRPNKVSMFYKDEVSGFFEMMNKREYMSGMGEVLASLYDVPEFRHYKLRKEVIRIESPAFIFFGGGVKDSVFRAVNENFILSGFLPRFLVASGDTDMNAWRGTGPPTEQDVEKRTQLANFFMDLKEQYGTEIPHKIGGQTVLMPPRIMAELTDPAWDLYRKYEREFSNIGQQDELSKGLMSPTFERLSRSILKMAIILAATRQEPKTKDNHTAIEVTPIDIQNAVWYGQTWGANSIELIQNAGKGKLERIIHKIIDAITDRPGISRGQIMNRFHLDRNDASLVLDTMEERGLMRKEKSGRGWRYFIIDLHESHSYD
jgi:Protein of unknown function (DUF3987)